MYLIIDKVNGCIDEYNENKYLTLLNTDEDALNEYEELCKKSKILLDQQAILQTIMIKKSMKIRINSDYDLPATKTN